jgi:hypothetical protein
MFELLTETAKADRDLLIKNNEAGDDFNKPREVDFAFEAVERGQADDFAEFVMGKSYGTAQVSELEPGRFRVVVLIAMPINQNIINSVSGFMLCLSRLFKVDYPGMGIDNPKTLTYKVMKHRACSRKVCFLPSSMASADAR